MKTQRIYAKDLEVGMEIVGFMHRTARVVEVDDKPSGEFTYFRVEDMPRDRMRRFQDVDIKVPDEPQPDPMRDLLKEAFEAGEQYALDCEVRSGFSAKCITFDEWYASRGEL